MTLGAELWQYLRWPIMIGWLWWAFVWLLVTVYYLQATLRLRRSLNPQYKGGAVRLWLVGVVRAAALGLVSLVRGQYRNPKAADGKPVILTESLQHGVVCSAMGCVISGFATAHANRGDFSVLELSVAVFFVMLSTVGGMMHLYAPMHQRRIGLWRTMMLASWLGSLLSYGAAYFLWSYHY